MLSEVAGWSSSSMPTLSWRSYAGLPRVCLRRSDVVVLPSHRVPFFCLGFVICLVFLSGLHTSGACTLFATLRLGRSTDYDMLCNPASYIQVWLSTCGLTFPLTTSQGLCWLREERMSVPSYAVSMSCRDRQETFIQVLRIRWRFLRGGLLFSYDIGGDSVGTLPFQFQGMGYSADSSTSAGSSSFCAESPAISDVQDFRPVQWDVFSSD